MTGLWKATRTRCCGSSMLGLGSAGANDDGADAVQWEELVDHLPTLYSWASTAVERLSRYARYHPTAAPAATLCRACFEALHADDKGSGAHFSPSAASMLRDAVEQASTYRMVFERARALQLLSIYSPIASERSNSLRKATGLF